MLYMNLKVSGELIKRNRERQGLTLSELSKETGMELLILKALEEGQYKPKYSELMKISAVIHVPPIAIMHGRGWDRKYQREY